MYFLKYLFLKFLILTNFAQNKVKAVIIIDFKINILKNIWNLNTVLDILNLVDISSSVSCLFLILEIHYKNEAIELFLKMNFESFWEF